MSTIDRRLHDRALELAASALDFGLGGAETAELETHLAACPACARSSRALRLDAMALRSPTTLLPSRRVDDAVYRAVAGRTLRSPSRAFVIMAATLLLLVALLGIAAAGASLLRNRPSVVVVPSPSAPAVVVVNPSPSPAPQPSATSVPTTPSESPSSPASPLPSPSPLPALPVASGTVRMAPGPDHGLYVVVNGAPSGSVVALLSAGGPPRPGWPVALEGWNCDGPNEPFVPVVASDGSVRLVCSSLEPSDGSPTVRAFALDPSGELLPGWPVELPANVWDQPRAVGDRLFVAAHESSDQKPYAGAYWLVEVAADGTVRTGSRYEIASDAANWPVAVGPDGIAYRRSLDEVAAFDMDGLRPGWPVKPGGALSSLAFDPTARVVVAVSGDAGTSRLMTLDRDGAVVRTSSALPFVGASPWSGAGPDGYPMAPLVAADGSAYVIAEADGRALLYRVDPSGTIPAGWPQRAATTWQSQGTGQPPTTGGGLWRATPAIDPEGAIYLPLAAPDPEIGGSLSAIGPEGSGLPGWPVHLAGNGAEFWSIVAGSDGTVFALAVEPSTGGSTSATLLAIAKDGTVRWRSTLVDPEAAR
jgi:hypothetical protein